jgi:hypothetical protein
LKQAVYEAVLPKRVFTVAQIVSELMERPEFSIWGREFVRKRVEQALKEFLSQGVIRLYSSDPVRVFLNPIGTEELDTKAFCRICGEEFFPLKSNQVYCSKRCRDKADYYAKYESKKVLLRERKYTTKYKREAYARFRELNEALRQKTGRWSNEELEILRQAMERKSLSKEEIISIARELGRSIKSVQHKYYRLKQGGEVANPQAS